MFRKPIVILLLGMLIGCGQQDPDKDSKDSPRIVKASSIEAPAMNAKVALGSSVVFSLTAGEQKVDSVIITYKGKNWKFNSGSFNWEPATSRVGNFNFQLNVYVGGKEEAHFPRLKMLSDIQPEQYKAVILGAYDHDPKAYTQGLFFLENRLIESTGEQGKSTLRKVHPVTGDVLKNIPMGENYFGEGCTLYKDKIYQLTWQSRVGFIYDLELNSVGTFQYASEGWGLTTLGDTLIMSDGSEKLYFMNPIDFTPIDQLEVYDHTGPITQLNELETVNGLIYANRYQTDFIYVIEPASGKVLRKINLSGLLTPAEAEKADVLNGIAYDAEGDRLFVTGKWWPWLFEIKLQPLNNPS